jgi:hypothetical protein
MKTLETIKVILSNQKERLFLKYPIKEMAIFGSVSRGDDTTESDVDILVELNQPIGIEFIDLADELQEILNKKVDLVSRKGIKNRYFKHIKNELKYV